MNLPHPLPAIAHAFLPEAPHNESNETVCLFVEEEERAATRVRRVFFPNPLFEP
jgi:hypothetical protein